MAFKSIIFDCDGVLVDSEIIANRIEAEVKTEMGFPISLEDQLRNFVGLGMNNPIVVAEHKRLPPQYLQIVDDRVKEAYLKELKVLNGVHEVLEQLSLPKCVASNSELESLFFKLELTGIKHHFGEAIFSAAQVKKTKPAPDLFLLALEQMKWKSQNTLVVEDSVAGVQAAKAADLKVWGYLGGGHIRPGHRERLIQAGADHIITDLRDLLELVC